MVARVYNIDWDTSDFTEEEEIASGVCVPDLPSEVFIPFGGKEMDGEDIEDYLSDKYEFCVNGFQYEIVG